MNFPEGQTAGNRDIVKGLWIFQTLNFFFPGKDATLLILNLVQGSREPKFANIFFNGSA